LQEDSDYRTSGEAAAIDRAFTNPSGNTMKEFLTQFFTWWSGQTYWSG
jgi:hypothetical protein